MKMIINNSNNGKVALLTNGVFIIFSRPIVYELGIGSTQLHEGNCAGA